MVIQVAGWPKILASVEQKSLGSFFLMYSYSVPPQKFIYSDSWRSQVEPKFLVWPVHRTFARQQYTVLIKGTLSILLQFEFHIVRELHKRRVTSA